MEGLVVNNTGKPDPDFWRGKRVLVTGHSGFKGSWLTIWLNRLGARVTGISLVPDTTPNLFDLAENKAICDSRFCDIRDADRFASEVTSADPEIVFHLAAQPLVRAGYLDPKATFATNVMGSVHLLDALRRQRDVRSVVMVTTDKVYRNNEWHWPYREDDELGGHDPYSASKAASEIAIASYRAAFLSAQDVAIASARAGNVIGGGDWSMDRLISDAVKAWQSGQVLEIRRPDAVRPWQHVLEPLSGYLALAERLWEDASCAGAYNFGPPSGEVATVRDVIGLAHAAYGSGDTHFGDGNEGPHEAGLLVLETTKSRQVLGTRSRWSLQESLQYTMGWYRAQHQGADAKVLCDSDLDIYEAMP